MLKHLKEFKLENAAELNVGDDSEGGCLHGRQQGRRYRHQQGPRLRGRYQAPRRTAHPPATAAVLFTVTQAPWAPAPTPARNFRGKIGAGPMGVDQVTR